MNQMGGQSQFSDEDLRKLAILLQQMPANEGLASINQDEAELMKSYGGSGAPLPGTQGLGPGGDLVRSYNGEGNGDDDDWGGGSGDTYGGYDSGDSSGTFGGYGDTGYQDWPGGGTTTTTPTTTTDSGGTPPPPPPPPKYYDMNGKEFSSQAEADASTARIKAAMATIENLSLTTDTTYERWLARNKDNEGYSGLTPEQIETAFTTALTKSQEDASLQVPKMVETMNNFFATTDADGNKLYGGNTTFEEFKAAVGGEMPVNLSEATLRDMYANAVLKFQRGEAFTLTPEEVAEFSRPAIQTAPVADAEKVEIDDFDTATMTDVGEVADCLLYTSPSPRD